MTFIRIPKDWSQEIRRAKRELARSAAIRKSKQGSHGIPSFTLDTLHHIQCGAGLRGYKQRIDYE